MGKRNSSRNSIRHGLLASTVCLEGENKRRFLSLLNTLLREHNPQSAIERALVESIAIARWRMQRLWGLEKTTLDTQMAREQQAAQPDRAGAAFLRLADNSRVLDLMHRYESRFENQFLRAERRLQELRSARETRVDSAARTQPTPRMDSTSTQSPVGLARRKPARNPARRSQNTLSSADIIASQPPPNQSLAS